MPSWYGVHWPDCRAPAPGEGVRARADRARVAYGGGARDDMTALGDNTLERWRTH